MVVHDCMVINCVTGELLHGTPRNFRSHVTTSTPQALRGPRAPAAPAAPLHPLHPLHHQLHREATYRGSVLHKDGTELSKSTNPLTLYKCTYMQKKITSASVQMPWPNRYAQRARYLESLLLTRLEIGILPGLQSCIRT